MSSGQQGANASGIFKWQWHGGQGESSLRKGLLNDVPPEIELAEYQRLSSAGSDSPSGLLNGESLKVEPIADLDLFFERLYNYYCEKGLWCIITKWIVELLSLGFTICFSGFFLLFVDWHGLRNAKCGIDAVESGIKPCDLARDALHRHPLVPFTFSKGIVIGYLGIFTIYWVFCFLRFFAQLKDTLKIRDFYYNSLNVTDHEIQTTPWAEILEKVVHIQRSQQLCVVKDLSELDVVMRIMRKDNYLIGMLNKGVLAFPIPRWVPGAGPAVISGANGRKNHLILTKTLEWTLNWCILQSMFDRNFSIRADFVSNPSSLKKRLIAVGLVMLLISPFLVIFMLVYFFLRHAEQFYNHPSTASSRRWSNLSKWIFREFNEVDHLFRHRINASVVHAADYIKQFPSPIVSLIAKFISFVAGGFAAILIIIALLDESLLEAHIFGRNLLWYAAIFGTVTAISRAAITDEFQVLDPEGAMSVVVQHTHYMPKRWRGKENTDLVRTEFEALFQYTGIMLLEEMASIFLTPCLLFFFVPKRVDDILQFISDFTVEIQGVGHVCSLSAFDFERHGNSNYGSPYSTSRERRSSQGKMEKSFLGFQSSYRTWEPDTQGKQFQSTMRDFRKQMQRQESQRSPTRTWQGNQALRNTGEFHRSLSRDEWGQPRSSSPYSVNIGRKNYMFLLDWVYTTRVLHPMDPREAPDSPSQLLEEPRDNFWMPYDVGPEPGNDKWGFSFEDEERLGRSQLEASTSSPFFRDSLFRRHHRDVNQPGAPTESHWWARTGPQSSAVQNSFIEPPSFGRQHDFDHPCDSISEEHAVGGLDFRNSSTLFKSGYIDGDGDHEEDGGFNLPFHDIYNTPPRVESCLTRSERMNDELNVVIDRGLDFK